MYKTILHLLLCLLIIFLDTACDGRKMNSNKIINDSTITISNEQLNNIAHKKIYFGHQSVGFNIIDGINEVLKQNHSVKLDIVKTKDPEILNKPVFAHSTIGDNANPELKINEFKYLIENGIGNKADIAFFKFCYLDINKSIDIEELFLNYKETMAKLKSEYPDTVFVHITIPLTTSQPSLKSFIKKLIGRTDNNIMRNEFNEKLLKEYANKEPIFDLAKIESTSLDKSRVTFTSKGKTYYSLAPEYTNDGGHLNEVGRRQVAKEFLTFLSNVRTE